jgi:hypothetical protein
LVGNEREVDLRDLKQLTQSALVMLGLCFLGNLYTEWDYVPILALFKT